MTGATGRRRAVAVDVTPLLTLRTGIGRSVAEVLGALARLADPPVVLPYALGARSRRYRPQAPAGTRFVPLPTRVLLAAWGRGEVPRLDRWLHGAGVVHATNFVVPASRLPTVVTVHDCSFELFPETVNPVVARFGAILRRALARGATVHVTSEQVAREVENLFGPGLEAAGRLAVIPFGVPAIDLSLPTTATAASVVNGGPYVLALGRIEPRKNLPALVRAFVAAELPVDVRLVLAGPDGHGRSALEEAIRALPGPLRRRVLVLGPVSEGDRTALLQRAAVLAYPSLYEGFGFPALEAMTLGVPVLAADVPALAEVTGGAAMLADPRDEAALAAGLTRLLTDAQLRGQLTERGRERAAAFSWDRTAHGLDEVYRRLSTSS